MRLLLFAVMTLTIGLAVFSITLQIPFATVSAFSSKGAPEQSCSPNGVSGTDLNPNCIGGRIPSCSSNGEDEGKAGCRDQGTCDNHQPNDKRKSGSTPACAIE